MKRFVIGGTAAALAATLGAGPAEGQVLRYGGAPGEMRVYQREQSDRVVQTVNARQLATTIEIAGRLTAEITAADSGRVTMTIVHDSLAVVESGAAAAPDLSDLYDVPIVVEMDRKGAVDAVRLPEELPASASRFDLAGTYRFFFPRLPEGEAEAATVWSDTTTATAVQGGLELQVVRVNRYVSRGWTAHGASRVIRVDYETELTIRGSGEQEEAGIVLSGTGDGSGGFSFDPQAGTFVAGGETLEMRMVALVSAQGQDLVVPIVQNRSLTVTLVEGAGN